MGITLEFDVDDDGVEITGNRDGLNALAQAILNHLRRTDPQSSGSTLCVRHYSSPGPHRISIFLDEGK